MRESEIICQSHYTHYSIVMDIILHNIIIISLHKHPFKSHMRYIHVQQVIKFTYLYMYEA